MTNVLGIKAELRQTHATAIAANSGTHCRYFRGDETPGWMGLLAGPSKWGGGPVGVAGLVGDGQGDLTAVIFVVGLRAYALWIKVTMADPATGL